MDFVRVEVKPHVDPNRFSRFFCEAIMLEFTPPRIQMGIETEQPPEHTTHTPSIAFRPLLPKGSHKPFLGVCIIVMWWEVLHCFQSFLKCCFTSTETVGLLGTGVQDVHLHFHTVPELCFLLTYKRRVCVRNRQQNWDVWIA